MHESIDARRRAAGLSWTELAERVGGPRVHTIAALLGQHPLSAEQARRAAEVLGVYGPALRVLLHEEFGDGIMSAINFNIDLRRVPHPGGDRVEVVLSGKFLPYQWE